MTQVRDRIRELRRVKARDLRPNPRNWRTHPAAQQNVLRGVLAEIGYADALLVRETEDGELMLIDGHLRAETTPDCEVPVLVLDVNEAEADKLLATIDPLSQMAQQDSEKLAELLADVRTDSEALAAMLTELKPAMMLDSDEPPASVAETIAAMEQIKSQRKKGNEKVVSRTDTEKYLVLVYRSRELKEAALAELGLPTDERYVSADAVTLKPKYTVKPVQTNGRALKSASAKKAGACG